MNSSVERVRATSWNRGRRARRPATTISTRATAAWPRARASAQPLSPPSSRPSTAIANRAGATARSWNSRTAKLVRPVGALSRFCSASTGSTTAVDDRASPMPTIGANERHVEPVEDGRQDQRGAAHLQGPEPENQAPQDPQPLPRQLDPDHEHQEDDAELGQMRDLGAIADSEEMDGGVGVGQPAESERAQKGAGADEAEHRRDAQAVEQRHHDARRDEEQDRFLVGAGMDLWHRQRIEPRLSGRRGCHHGFAIMGRWWPGGNRIRARMGPERVRSDTGRIHDRVRHLRHRSAPHSRSGRRGVQRGPKSAQCAHTRRS